MKVVIMRGIPGSGKTTWHEREYPESIVLSADQYFIHDGKYEFDAKLLPFAHNECVRRFLTLISSVSSFTPLPDDQVIIVDNTNVRAYEISPYYRVAESLLGKDSVQIVTVRTTPEVCVMRNVHGVPAETIYRMCDTFEQLPAWWNQVTVLGV